MSVAKTRFLQSKYVANIQKFHKSNLMSGILWYPFHLQKKMNFIMCLLK